MNQESLDLDKYEGSYPLFYYPCLDFDNRATYLKSECLSSNHDLPEHPSDVPTCISHSKEGGQHIYMIG